MATSLTEGRPCVTSCSWGGVGKYIHTQTLKNIHTRTHTKIFTHTQTHSHTYAFTQTDTHRQGCALRVFVIVVEIDTAATRVQILDETDCILHSTNTLGKGMNPIILPPPMGK